MKKNYSKSLLSGLCFILCIGVLIGFGRVIKDSEKPSSSTHEIISRGIEARMLSSTTNSYGEKDQVFTYSLTPSNASNQEIEISMAYSDDSDCSEVMEYSLDATNKQITLSCKAPFSKQINVVLKSKANENATATIVLDYVKKLKKVTFKTDDFIYVNDYAYKSSEYTKISSFQPESFFTPEYSVYTKDTTFRYFLYIDELALKEKTADLSEDFINTFASNLKSRVNTKNVLCTHYFGSSEIWNMASTNADKSVLKAISKSDVDAGNGYLCYEASVRIVLNQVQVTNETFSGSLTLYFSMYGAYSGTVGVDSLGVESSTLEF